MNKLTYNKSKIYPDNTKINWCPNVYHEGFVNGRLTFRVQRHGDSSSMERWLEMRKDDGDWYIVSKTFHEATLFCDLLKHDKDKALKYDYCYSLQACHQVAGYFKFTNMY
jgi:hypothetical protein